VSSSRAGERKCGFKEGNRFVKKSSIVKVDKSIRLLHLKQEASKTLCRLVQFFGNGERLMPDTGRYGLPRKVFYRVIGVLTTHSDVVEEAILYGSRATGRYYEGSDIDIALKFRADRNRIYRIRDELDQLNVVYTFDVIDYHEICNASLRRRIDAEGRVLFSTNRKGEVMMSADKVSDRIEVLARALAKLHESLQRDYMADDVVVDATIQRFEFTYELSWKLMKAYLEYNGNTEGVSPRRAIQESFKEGLVSDGEGWLQMLQDRNLTSHTYDSETALKILAHIRERYVVLFDALLEGVRDRMGAMVE